VDELVLLESHEDGVDRALDDVREAEGAQGRRDFVAVGFTATDDLEHAALEDAFEHFGEVFQGDASLRNKLNYYSVILTTTKMYHVVAMRSTEQGANHLSKNWEP
jgi:hypothetical protein